MIYPAGASLDYEAPGACTKYELTGQAKSLITQSQTIFLFYLQQESSPLQLHLISAAFGEIYIQHSKPTHRLGQGGLAGKCNIKHTICTGYVHMISLTTSGCFLYISQAPFIHAIPRQIAREIIDNTLVLCDPPTP